MKQPILCIFLFSVTLLRAQTKDPALNQRIAAYLQLSKNLDVNKLSDYLYPRIYELAPREAIISQLKQTFTDTTIKVAVDSVAVLAVDAITVAGTTSFARLKYLSGISMQFRQRKDSAEDMSAAYLEMFKAKFGAANVRFNGENNTFYIKSIKYALAVKDRYSKNNWTFIGIEKNSMLTKILPAAAVKKYKL